MIAGPDHRTINFDVIPDSLLQLRHHLRDASAVRPYRATWGDQSYAEAQAIFSSHLVITSNNRASWHLHSRLDTAVETWGRLIKVTHQDGEGGGTRIF